MDYDSERIEHFHLFGGEVRGIERRADGGDDLTLTGTAAVFDQWADLGMFRERIAQGAFSKALPTSDVRLLVNHEGLPLARTSSGTMTLKETKDGLELRASLDPSDPDVRAIVPKIERGDLSQFSFAFSLAKDGQEWKGDDRTLTEFKEIFDVSLVTFPAYEQTKVAALRSVQNRELLKAFQDIQTSRLREAVHGLTR